MKKAMKELIFWNSINALGMALIVTVFIAVEPHPSVSYPEIFFLSFIIAFVAIPIMIGMALLLFKFFLDG